MEPLLIGLLVFTTILTGVMAIARRNPEYQVVAARLTHIRQEHTSRAEVLALPFHRRAFIPLVASTARLMGKVIPPRSIDAVRSNLARAGQRYADPVAWVLLKWARAGLLGGAAYGAGALLHRPLPLQAVSAFAFAGLGYLWPELAIRRKIRQRQARIMRELPETLDLLTISVEAGLGLDQALEVVATRRPGPLAEEIRAYLEEVRLGGDRHNALRAIGSRTGLEELVSFTGALIQAMEFGVSIAKVLRIQASEVRTLRRQRIEERAMKTPIKMLFPIIFLILPAVFVVVGGPGLIRIYSEFIKPVGPARFGPPAVPGR
ncbi:MAG: type II secretion system F family protein [Armatimonadota bacterium]|nr:type II secretion system F family protein [Armatimonadota bacterium]MDR7463314.1 type II secretion system F family protein [Armatimonadota bacterium]MDR7468952.1 type II secretion system F family protein [Armatimonadota bacterium]MDR7473997.1 type II secretion system F family protein [Armatimonadota bacterium]MDR7537992.1 type II secretion system F family protein [Armatimonadota bacterium]